MNIPPYIFVGISLNKSDPYWIINLVCENMGIDKALINADTRKEEIVIARHIGRYLYLNYTTYNKSEIAKFYNTGHATIIHSNKVIKNAIDTKEKKIYPYLKRIEKLINITDNEY